jgi:hypothetical protein
LIGVDGETVDENLVVLTESDTGLGDQRGGEALIRVKSYDLVIGNFRDRRGNGWLAGEQEKCKNNGQWEADFN